MKRPAHTRAGGDEMRYILAVEVSFLLGLGVAIEPAVRVANCMDDADFGARLIQGNEILSLLAPAGQGRTT